VKPVRAWGGPRAGRASFSVDSMAAARGLQRK